ncbi:nucleoredoxin-like protein 1 isoform X1 [Phyllopteryx taeniolatus]|uniref:nucleoredoxin-like protein 1 isoform X1 n=1 Tax=Phyllopteryx taeniolatus TaxID=161469 RepID=UPI002AD47C80|nr:nucleoredoxin-like protein 1 isoform X1 [Phyllopteryx taeniolatus]
MVDFFVNRVLVENNWDQDELNTEREIVGILENRILLLLFASAECGKCKEFVPVLNDFFKRLKDPAYIEYPRLLALIYIRSQPATWLVFMTPRKMRSCAFTCSFPSLRSLDQSEEQQGRFLKEMHKKVLFLAFEDPYRKELQAKFKVKDVPTVVVLRPDGSVLSPNAVQDIYRLGSECFLNWQESSELIERSFMLNEEFDNLNMRSATDPVRRLKYKTEDDKRKKRWWRLWGRGRADNEESGSVGYKERGGL